MDNNLLNSLNNNGLDPQNDNSNNNYKEDPNRSDKFSIATFIMVLIAIGSAGFILYKVYQDYKPKEVLDKDVPVNRYVSSIDINDELVSKLRDLIPRNGFCNNVYYAKQYIDKKFLDGDIVIGDVNVNDCHNIPSVYYVNVKVVSDKDRVYIYDLNILFDPISGYYGKNSLEYNIEYDDIELDVDEAGKASASIRSLKEYGQVYKYTFFEAGTDTFVYESTEPVDYSFIEEEHTQGEPESIPEEELPMPPEEEEEDTEEENDDESNEDGEPNEEEEEQQEEQNDDELESDSNDDGNKMTGHSTFSA